MTPETVKLLDVIRAAIERDGCSPSIRTIASELGLKGFGSIHSRIQRLIDTGVLTRTTPHRGVRFTSEPDLRLASTGALRAELARRERGHG